MSDPQVRGADEWALSTSRFELTQCSPVGTTTVGGPVEAAAGLWGSLCPTYSARGGMVSGPLLPASAGPDETHLR